MQGASAEGRNWGSPSAMAESGTKKARPELPNGHVKQEVVEQEPAGGDGAVVAAEYGPTVELAVRLDMRVLNCPLCNSPFKPPVLQVPSFSFLFFPFFGAKLRFFCLFQTPMRVLYCVQCNGGHLACGGCVSALPGGQCDVCELGDGFFGPCPALDAVVSSAKVACPHSGCGRYVVYHEAGEHQSACPHAPCHCTEPGCAGFAASPAALAGHLAAVHAVPIHAFKYGKVTQLQVPASVHRLLLVAENDARVFLLTVGAGAAALTVVCVRGSAAARPTFTCKMWANLPEAAVANGHGSKSDAVLVQMQMRSSTSPGAVVAADEPTFLMVPQVYLVPAPGDGPSSMEVALSVRIDKVSPLSC